MNAARDSGTTVCWVRRSSTIAGSRQQAATHRPARAVADTDQLVTRWIQGARTSTHA